MLADIHYAPLLEHITAPQKAQLEQFAELLVDEAMPAGFIGDCSKAELYLRHIFDAILPAIASESRATFPLLQEQPLEVFDLGAGAGLPSLPLAILFPQHRFHLLDAQEKRCRFAESAAGRVGLANAKVYHGVVQDFRKKYPSAPAADIVIFRAFRKILAALELSLHVLRNPQGGAAGAAYPKVLYWRSQSVPFSATGLARVADLGYETDTFVKFASAAEILPRGLYTFSRRRAAKPGFPRSWKKISNDKLVETES